jgi:hypothetical protein
MSSTNGLEFSVLQKAAAEALIFGAIWTVLAWLGSAKAKKACVRSRVVFMALYVVLRVSLTNFDRAMGGALVSAILHALPFTDLLAS